jgi:hypothetical protein
MFIVCDWVSLLFCSICVIFDLGFIYVFRYSAPDIFPLGETKAETASFVTSGNDAASSFGFDATEQTFWKRLTHPNSTYFSYILVGFVIYIALQIALKILGIFLCEIKLSSSKEEFRAG